MSSLQCGECDQSFRQKQLLKRHKNLYHTPDYIPPAPRNKQHECQECGRTFAHRGNLLRHMALHDPNNPEYQDLIAQEGEIEEEGEPGVQYVQIVQVGLITCFKSFCLILFSINYLDFSCITH